MEKSTDARYEWIREIKAEGSVIWREHAQLRHSSGDSEGASEETTPTVTVRYVLLPYQSAFPI
jgi:hypothetical protein